MRPCARLVCASCRAVRDHYIVFHPERFAETMRHPEYQASLYLSSEQIEAELRMLRERRRVLVGCTDAPYLRSVVEAMFAHETEAREET
jgi:hypothetical protein